MPKQEKIPKVTDNLNEFVSQLLSHIANESPDGVKKLTGAMEQAKSLYKKPIASWITGWVYGYYRQRGSEVGQVIGKINATPDASLRLKEIKTLVEKGEWHADSSYNYFLLVELIKLVPNYQPVPDKLMHSVVLLVKDKIIEKIDAFIADHQAYLKLKASQKKEIAPPKKPVFDHVLLANNLEAAQASAIQNPTKIQFSLFLKDKVWQVFWLDLNGKAYALTPGKELSLLLTTNKVENVLAVTADLAQRIRKECLDARDVFLGKIKLSINPKEVSKLTSTFILKGATKAYTLDWVDSLGKAKAITLETLPQLKSWLGTQDVITEVQSSQIKSYLISVSTSQSIQGMDKFKKQLSACLSHTSEEPIPAAAKVAKKLNLSLFADVERCLGARVENVASPKTNVNDEDEGTELISLPPLAKVRARRLTADQYAAVSKLFAPKVESDAAGEESASLNSLVQG